VSFYKGKGTVRAPIILLARQRASSGQNSPWMHGCE
jgi:hypothetical protein